MKNEFMTTIFFHLEKAYETTWRYLILKLINAEGLRGSLLIFIQNLFEKRYVTVKLDGNFFEIYTHSTGLFLEVEF